jgi:hypothetical protein
VEVEVWDQRPAEPVVAGQPGPDSISGRGLLLSAGIATAWGVTYERAAKAVWFRLALAAEVAAAA